MDIFLLSNKKIAKNDEQNVESTRGYFHASPDTDIYETDDDFKMIYAVPKMLISRCTDHDC